MQVSVRQLAAELLAQTVRDRMPALEPMKLTSTYFDNFIRDGESKAMGEQWNGAGGDWAFIVTYHNPRVAWLLAQAAVHCLTLLVDLATIFGSKGGSRSWLPLWSASTYFSTRF